MSPLQRQVSSTDSYNYLLFLPNGVHPDADDVYDGLRLRTQRYAIAPICGGGNPQAARNLKNLPVWAFHGAKDNVVP